ncbi:hypothetical protein G5I_12741 [Acromyrmex echinatior]|uniref:Uncharacterized protein n=2 Tax=Acromyrmex echinatior TaxID=103372 RepID=F4X350_ACREC|nr:hypothetical protein G5I_12741 [Acromyrmex echinatior]
MKTVIFLFGLVAIIISTNGESTAVTEATAKAHPETTAKANPETTTETNHETVPKTFFTFFTEKFKLFKPKRVPNEKWGNVRKEKKEEKKP